MPTVESSTLKVPPQLADAGSYLQTRANNMAAELARLWTRVEALEQTWQGVAHGQYAQYKAMWHTAANGLFGPAGVLPAISQIMNHVWQNYATGEANRKKSWDMG